MFRYTRLHYILEHIYIHVTLKVYTCAYHIKVAKNVYI